MAVILICFLAIICNIFQQGSALQCFTCESNLEDDNCSINPKLLSPVSCSADKEVCVKMTMTQSKFLNKIINIINIRGIPMMYSMIIRKCAKASIFKRKNYCYEYKVGGILKYSICNCSEDLCNSASISIAGTAFIIINLALLVL